MMCYLRDGEGVEDGDHVGDEVLPGGLHVLRRLVRKAVAAAVRRDGAVSGGGHCQHLVAPSVPYLREAVQEHHRPKLICKQHREQINSRSNPTRDKGALLCLPHSSSTHHTAMAKIKNDEEETSHLCLLEQRGG
jgi:hypothetical protein